MDDKWFVSFVGISVENSGQKSWGIFKSEQAFTEWYAGKMTDGSNRPLSEVYRIVYSGPSKKKAKESIFIFE